MSGDATPFRYSLDEKPPPAALLLYGLQWWVVALTCTVNMGLVVARLQFAGDAAGQVFFLQKLFVVIGAASLVQIVAGHRLPLVTGPASTLLVGIAASTGAGMDAVYTAAMIGGFAVTVVGYGGMMSRLRSVFTPRIVAVTLILVALTLGPTIIRLGTTGKTDGVRAVSLTFALLLPFAMLFLNDRLGGVAKALVLPLGMAGGSLCYWGVVGFPDFSSPGGASGGTWLTAFDFHAGTVLSFLFCFFALLVNELGSVEAVGRQLGAEEMGKRVDRGCGVTGVFNMLAGWVGVVGPVDYSLSAGVIPATGCASRYALLPAGALLALCGLAPGLVGVLAEIPGPVMAGIMLYVMALQIGSGLGIAARERATEDFTGGVIVGLPLMVGLVISFCPVGAFAAFPEMARSILGNGFVMGIIAVMALEHVVFRRRGK